MRLLSCAVVCLLLPLRAFASDGYGHVDFPNSGAPAAQADFLAGLALLHDFEYPAAIAAFKRAQALDAGFAMAYWGEAMAHTHQVWMEQDLPAARAVLARLGPTVAARRARAGTERERAYMDVVEVLYGDGSREDRDVRFEHAMAALHARYPDDVDATAFYGLAILGTAHAGRDVAVYMRAAGFLEEAWLTHQEHPGLLHYLIHCYDDPAHAPLGLRAARLYAKVAPDAGHAQHMTSHIFLALGMWQDTVNANLAANAAVRRMDGADPGCGHYPTWLAYAYLQLGQMDPARQALAACDARASSSPDTAMVMSMDPDDSRAGSLANMRLRYLIDAADWSGAAARMALPPNAGPGARLDFAFADGLRAIGLKDAAGARQALQRLQVAAREVVAFETRRGDSDPTYRVRPGIFVLQIQGLLAESRCDGRPTRSAVSSDSGRGDALTGRVEDHAPPGDDVSHQRRAGARAEFMRVRACQHGEVATLADVQ